MTAQKRRLRRGLSAIEEESDMAIAVHSGGELGKILMWVIAFMVFVVVALTWVPEWMAPQGEIGASDVGRTVKMIK